MAESTERRWQVDALDKFGLVLIACIVTFTLLIARNSSEWDTLTGSLPVLFTVIFTINAASPGRGLRLAALGCISVAIIVGAISAAHTETHLYGISMIFTALALAACIIAVLARMAQHSEVTVHTVLAVLSAYVMLGLFFAFLDSGFGHITGMFFAQPGAHSQSDYAYLSYITLTTVGFGDLTPGPGWARSLIITEALIGQIFLVTLVARMVSLYGTERAPMTIRQHLKQDKPPE
jgi:hypothetical protein